MAKRNSRRKRRYRAKPRFFVFFILLVCVIGSGVFFALNSNSSEETGPVTRRQFEAGMKIMMAARDYIHSDLTYVDTYFNGGYPPDNLGVCTDVVWKGMLGADVIIKDLMDRDVADNLDAYKNVISIPDPNIDFRLVPRLEVFFERNAEVLTNDVTNLLQWQPGDIVTFESSHVAIVSDLRNLFGYPYIIQHGKDPAAEEDRIFASDGMKISGHYRLRDTPF